MVIQCGVSMFRATGSGVEEKFYNQIRQHWLPNEFKSVTYSTVWYDFWPYKNNLGYTKNLGSSESQTHKLVPCNRGYSALDHSATSTSIKLNLTKSYRDYLHKRCSIAYARKGCLVEATTMVCTYWLLPSMGEVPGLIPGVPQARCTCISSLLSLL